MPARQGVMARVPVGSARKIPRQLDRGPAALSGLCPPLPDRLPASRIANGDSEVSQ